MDNKKIKDLIKKNPEPARGTVGVDPKDPWSAKANIAEDGSLNNYLKSRGINPQFLSTETKISHAKSSSFLKWKNDRKFESVELSEDSALDKFLLSRGINPSTVPTNIKVSYAKSASFIKWKQNHVQQEESKPSALEKFRKSADERQKKHNENEKNSGGMEKAIDRLEKHMKKEEVEQIDELKMSTMTSYKDKSTTSLKNAQSNRDASEDGKHMSKGFADLHAKSDAIAKKRVKGLKGYLQRKIGMKPTSEDVFQDPQAATQTCFDGANNTNDTSNKKKELSKSARIIKSLYKKHNMKEDTYDWEKDDKNQTSYGKKPKISKDDGKSPTNEKPDARAVLSGGTTLTGDSRDTLEIDPMMKNRPDLNGTVKDLPSKKKNKINNI